MSQPVGNNVGFYRKLILGNLLEPSPKKVKNEQNQLKNKGHFKSIIRANKKTLIRNKISVIIPPHPFKTDLISTKFGQKESKIEALDALWPYISYSRFFGLFPISRCGNNLHLSRPNPWWFPTAITFLIQTMMLGLIVKNFLIDLKINNKVWTSEIVSILSDLLYYGHGLCNCLYNLVKCGEISQFFEKCRHVETIVYKKYASDSDCKGFEKIDSFAKKTLWIFAFFITAQCIGNVLYEYSVGAQYNATSIEEYFESFNREFYIENGNMYSGIFFFGAQYICESSWSSVDILLALISFIMTNKIIECKGHCEADVLEGLRKDHRELADLVKVVNTIFSPIFLMDLMLNTGYLFARLYSGITEDLSEKEHISVKIETIFAFCYQIMKIFLPIWFASILNEKAGDALELIHNWPSKSYNSNANTNTNKIFLNKIDQENEKYRILVIGRFVSQLVTEQIGISGCGYFIISKSFFVTLISLLITYEVIILQFQASGK